MATLNFPGTQEQLEQLIINVGIAGTWTDSGSNRHYTTANGGILCYAPSTGSIWFQGKAAGKAALEQVVASAVTAGIPAAPAAGTRANSAPMPAASNGTRIFVVHGHDEAAREQLELVLHKLGLEPFVLQNSGGGGLTIIEALEKEIATPNRTHFGIVLMTPDDMGYSAKEGSAAATARPRQNVVLEMGMMIAAMTRSKVAILKKGHLETPSDAAGILYKGFNKHVREVVPWLVDRLRDAGIAVSADAVTRASS